MTRQSLTTIQPQANLPHLRACASAVHWRLERKGHKGRHRDRVWLLHCDGDQRRFKALVGVQRAVFDELEICYSYARFGRFLESVLSDPTHASHEATSAWWGGGADPFNDRVTGLFKRIPAPDVNLPTLWTAEDRQHLVPRAHQDERLLEYMQRQ